MVSTLIKQKNIDVVLFESGVFAVFGLLILRLIRKKYPAVKFILRVHAIADTERILFPMSATAKLHAYFTRKFYRACSVITATNNYHVDFIKKNFLREDPFIIGKKIFFVIPNIVRVPKEEMQDSKYCEIFERMQGKKTFFALGGMSRGGVYGQGKFVQKGFLDILYALFLIKDRSIFREIFFVIVGRGAHHQYFKEEVRRLGLNEYVEVIDFLPNHIVHRIQQRVHVTVLVSRVEGLSMFALEALANGSPLLVTKTGGLLDLVKEGENGFFAEVQNIEDISEKIVLLASLSEDEIQKMRERSSEIFRSTFSPEIVADRFVKFSELLLRGEKGYEGK